jgi:hypothetical protein
VWSELFKYNQWNPQHIGAKVIRLAGTPDQEGYIVLEYKKSGSGYEEPIVIEIVKLIPYQKLVWRLYDQQAHPIVGYVDFSLSDQGADTKFAYDAYSEYPEERRKEQLSDEEYRKILSELFGALKKHVEAL